METSVIRISVELYNQKMTTDRQIKIRQFSQILQAGVIMFFLGCLFEKKNEEYYLSKSKHGLSNAANHFQWNLINGLNENLQEPVKIVNALPVGTFPLQYEDLLLKDRTWSYCGAVHHEIGCINLPFIKQYQRFKKCQRLLKKTDDKEILIYSAYLPFLKAVERLDHSYHVTVVITDLPEYYDLGKTSFIKRFLRNQNNKKVYRCLKRADAFVLLTEQMKEPLHVDGRPYVVIEGICNGKIPEKDTIQTVEKSILYTGTLHKRFGIGNLLTAFSMIEDPDYKLWICGSGDMQEEIQQAAKKDSRITYFGYLPKNKIEELQQRASILVNPRPNEGDYTKYSFPSKTMEYMLSGKPVVMYKLDGIPAEYDKYLFYADDSLPAEQGLKEAITAVTNDMENAQKKASSAQSFIAENKSSKKQARTLLRFLQQSTK